MMRTPAYLDTHADALTSIWSAGWDMALHRTPVGVFFRLEKGILYRGGLRTGWWWRPTVAQAMRKLAAEAEANPRRHKAFLSPIEFEWEES